MDSEEDVVAKVVPVAAAMAPTRISSLIAMIFIFSSNTMTKHVTMETIVKPAMRLDTTTIDQSHLAQFTKLAKQAEQEWTLVEKAKFDLGMFGKNKQQQKQFPAMLRAERDSLRQLNDALTKDGKEAIIKSARGLKPPFAKVYMFFGDFPKPTQGAR